MRILASSAVTLFGLALGVLSAANQQQSTVATPNLLKFHAKTAEQKVRARFFDYPNSRPLRPNTIKNDEFERAAPPHALPDYEAYLRKEVCGAELVALGRPMSQEAFVTISETTIFTDYAFAVDQWLRGLVTYDRPQASTTLTVTLRGGKIDTDAGPIEVQNEQPLTRDHQYILFLRRIPETASYQVSAPTLVSNSVVTSMDSPRDVPESLLHGTKPINLVLADIHRIASSCGR